MSLYDTTPTLATEQAQASNTGALATGNTDTMSTTEAKSVLNNYGVDATQVLSSSNVSDALKNINYNTDDLLGIRGSLNTALGLDTATQKLNSIKAQYYKAPSVIEGQRLNMSVLRGETGLAQQRLLAEIQAQQDSVSSLTSERDYRLGIAEKNVDFTKQLKLQYAGAKINYGDSMDTVEKKLVSYQKEQKKEAEKDAIKSALRQLGLKTSGSTKELESRLSKYSKSALKEAKQKSDLQLEAMRIDIANTKSIIAERNSTSNTSWTPARAYGDNQSAASSSNQGMSIDPANAYFNNLNQWWK